MTTTLEDLGQHSAPPPGMIYPPSHLTRAQAARILKRTGGTVYGQSRKGGPLEAEKWWGTPMVPMWRIIQALREQQKDLD